MANNQPKLLPARARVSTALMNAATTPFSPRMTAAVKALVQQQQKRKKKSNDSLQNPTQLKDF